MSFSFYPWGCHFHGIAQRGVLTHQGWPLQTGVLTSGVAFTEGCPHVRGGLYEGFHCSTEYS